jgi:hypothetical protein
LQLKNKKNFWLIPRRLKETCIDAIYILSDCEIWLVQFTRASKCNLDKDDLIRAKNLFLEIFGDQVNVKFVVLVPTVKAGGIDLDKDLLKSHGIPFMVGEISNV